MRTDAMLPASSSTGRPGVARMLANLTGHALRSFLRNPVAAFFTAGFPVVFLVIIGGLVGNDVIEPRGGVRVAQFFTPALAVFGAAQAAFSTLASDTARLREGGVFKRLRSAPAPPWMVLAARVLSAVVIAALAVGLVFVIGVALYDVQIIWRTLPAAVVTLSVGVAAFAALGLAVVALVPSANAVQSFTNGLLICLAFISDVFAVSPQMPSWLERLGWFFPLRHFANAFSDAFNPFLTGSGFAPGHLAVLGGWGVAGALVAVIGFSWEPHAAWPRRGGTVALAGPARAGLPHATFNRPSVWASLRTQIGYALLTLWRDGSSVFFALIFPVLLLGLFSLVKAVTSADRTEVAGLLLPALMTYGLAITAYAVLPAAIATARERRVLARLAVTPMPNWAFVVGRVAAALVATTASALALIALATLGFGVRLDVARLPAAAVTFLLGVACFAALGFALLVFVRKSQTFIAITLGTLLPLSFISDVFVIGARMPRPLAVFADLLPLKHTVHALNAALEPGVGGSGFAWADLAVVLAWTAIGLLIAHRLSWAER